MKSLQIIQAGIRSTFDFEGQASRREFWIFVPPLLVLSFCVYLALIPFANSKDTFLVIFVIAASISAPTMAMAARRANESGLGLAGAQYGPMISLFGLGLYGFHVSEMPPDPASTEYFPVIAAILFILGLAILTKIGLKPPLNQPPNEVLS
ncbi:hypothetical protein DS901_15230 [Loktanella sp. D2R18]|uniref:DUF805 domain-containing protein n=1 Tax=Rhodobacterales TaxID=204455 RepID=UPI000DEB47DF|nr:MULTISPECIES: DUF805 domain-containing protein [Rhodobacterales]MDO6588676.1 DUF805 domain-containing protein [Yoonia sp. 1_MG-2023]RBW42076.1 hypothetical protein DS901_15230 [Loktanella sp. D2R18]